MHKHVGMVIVALLVGTLFFVPSIADPLFALFFIGLVPFTDYTMPPSTMLIIYAVLLALGLYGVTRQVVTVASPVKRETQSRERARKKILRQTSHKQSAAQAKKHFLPAIEN